MGPRKQGCGDGAHLDESSNQVYCEADTWPGFKANDCSWEVRKAEGAA